MPAALLAVCLLLLVGSYIYYAYCLRHAYARKNALAERSQEKMTVRDSGIFYSYYVKEANCMVEYAFDKAAVESVTFNNPQNCVMLRGVFPARCYSDNAENCVAATQTDILLLGDYFDGVELREIFPA